MKTYLPLLLCALLSTHGWAQEEELNLAKELANPIASLYTLPLQMNFDEGLGLRGDGNLYQLNAQPLIPFEINKDWHLISRTIIPFINQQDVAFQGQSQSGLGDILQSFFLSPSETPENGLIWGVGPVASLPTASHPGFGIDSWALGPTAVVLKQEGQWTAGVLVNHLWSLGSDDNDNLSGRYFLNRFRAATDDRGGFNGSYIEPWVSYVLPSNNTTTISISAESTYDWKRSELGLPVNLIVDQLITIGKQPVSIGAALKYWIESPQGAPDGFGFRLQCTFLWPK